MNIEKSNSIAFESKDSEGPYIEGILVLNKIDDDNYKILQFNTSSRYSWKMGRSLSVYSEPISKINNYVKSVLSNNEILVSNEKILKEINLLVFSEYSEILQSFVSELHSEFAQLSLSLANGYMNEFNDNSVKKFMNDIDFFNSVSSIKKITSFN